jgi:hypothetical protein
MTTELPCSEQEPFLTPKHTSFPQSFSKAKSILFWLAKPNLKSIASYNTSSFLFAQISGNM